MGRAARGTAIAGVLIAGAAVISGCSAGEAAELDERTGPSEICKPGAGTWQQVAASEPILAGPDYAQNLTRSAVESCSSIPVIGHIGPPEQFSLAVEFTSDRSEEAAATWLRNAAGTAGWRPATSEAAYGCEVKEIDGASTYLSHGQTESGSWRAEIRRGDPGMCRADLPEGLDPVEESADDGQPEPEPEPEQQ